MKVGLLWEDGEIRWESGPDRLREDRTADLRLGPVLKAMGEGDPEVTEVCRQLLENPLKDREEILFRQEILREFIQKDWVLERMYSLCQEAENKRKNTWNRLTSSHLTTVYSSGADLIRIYMEALAEIRRVLEKISFSSRGLRRLSALLSRELSDTYLEEVRSLSYGIDSHEATLISADLGSYLQGVSYEKRQPDRGFSRFRWMLQPSYTLADRDMNGAKDLELRVDRAINDVANVMAQAAGSLQSFVDQLRGELSFYAGGVRLYRKLKDRGLCLCFPELTEDGERSYRGLYDGSMALSGNKPMVGNTVSARDRSLWLITGANQGGKTTFLRSVGLCQLMAQCGLFVFAEGCRIPVRGQLYTHFCREEDRSLHSGKLEEELSRMEAIVERIRPGDMLLSNESFSSTNDRDGSEILEGVVRGLLERQIEVFAVTHLIGFAVTAAGGEKVLSLRPERTEAGDRTYRLYEGSPTEDAYAEDIYRKVFRKEMGTV